MEETQVQQVERSRAQSLARQRTGLVIATFLLPLALFSCFERQARRLDALAAHGESVEARVTAVHGGGTFYAYRVNGSEFTWNVPERDAPFPVGQVFTATYLPEDPALSRPIADRRRAAVEAARNRSMCWKVVLALALTLAMVAGITHRDVCRLRMGAPSESADPRAHRRKFVALAIVLVPGLVLIGEFHLRNAAERGESIAPVVVALCLTIAVCAAVFFFVGRGGPTRVRERSARLLRWLVPIALGIAVLRLAAMLLGI